MRRAITKSENVTENEGASGGDEDLQLSRFDTRIQRNDERRRERKTTCGCCCCCSVRQCCYFVIICIAIIAVFAVLLSLVDFYRMFHHMQNDMHLMRRELTNEREKRRQLEDIRLQENQLQEAGARWLKRCVGQHGGGSFTGVRLFWGAIEIGYTSGSQLAECIIEYNDRFPQRLSLH